MPDLNFSLESYKYTCLKIISLCVWQTVVDFSQSGTPLYKTHD